MYKERRKSIDLKLDIKANLLGHSIAELKVFEKSESLISELRLLVLSLYPC